MFGVMNAKLGVVDADCRSVAIFEKGTMWPWHRDALLRMSLK